MVFIQEVDGQTSVFARTDSDATGETHEYEATGHPSVRRGAAFTLDHTLASTTGSGATLRVSGTFALGRRTLTAGSPSVVSERIYEPPPGTTTRYAFAADGGLRVEDTVGGQTVGHVGTWARATDEVTLTLPAAGGVTALTYRVEASGSELRLVRDSVDGPCDAACRARAEGRLALERATLSDFRRTETLRLRTGASQAGTSSVQRVTKNRTTR